MSNRKYSELEIDGVLGDVWDKEALHNQDIVGLLLDYIYPVGSIYISADSFFDPNEEWGGVWEQVEAGKVIVSAGTGYSVGATGGQASVTLTEDQCVLKSHTHIYKKSSTTTNSHALTVNQIPAHAHTIYFQYYYRSTGSYQTIGIINPNLTEYNYADTGKTGLGQGHSHGITLTDTATDAAASTATSPVSLMQPYIAYNIWRRTE